MLRKVEVLRYGKKVKNVKDAVAEDIKFKLVINGKEFFFRISGDLREEFVIGYCFSEGLIYSSKDFEYLNVEKNTAYAKINIKNKNREISEIKSDFKISYNEVIESMEKLKKFSEIWRKTGGTHACALVTNKEFIMVEDISKYACIDKLLGIAIKRGINFSNSYVVCTGRISEERVLKIARAGIPIIASMAAPLFSGVECAKKYGVTLLGFVRNGKINIYSHPERIRNKK